MTATNPYCPQCGTQRQGELRFCSSCGFDFSRATESAVTGNASQPSSAPVASPPAAAADEKKSRRVGCIALAVIAVVIVAIIGSLGGDGDQETAGASEGSDPSASVAENGGASPDSSPDGETGEPTVPPSAIESLDPEPAFADIVLTGTGNSVPRFDIPEDAAAIAEVQHTGAANFAVWAIDASGSQTDLLVNTIGNYSGTVLFDEAAGSHTDAFEVEADGSWTITVRPVTEAFRWDGSETLSGTGDDVVILNPPSAGLKSTTVTHDGSGNFAIWAYGPTTDLLVNEIGAYSGEVLLADGTFLLEISASGPWTVAAPQ